MKGPYLILFVASLAFAGCAVDVPKEYSVNSELNTTVPDSLLYDDKLIDGFMAVSYRFGPSRDPDSLRYAISILDEIIQSDSTFPGSYSLKYEFQCKLGEVEGALRTLMELYEVTDSPYVLPMISWTYERMGLIDSSRQVMTAAIGAFDQRCRAECSEADMLNLVFLKTVRGDIQPFEGIELLRAHVVDSNYVATYQYMADEFDLVNYSEEACAPISKSGR